MATYKPPIVTSAQIGLTFQNLFGDLGPELYVTGHHTAGPKDKDRQDAIRLAKIFHQVHKDKGWGGAGYHYMIARDGTIIGLRPTRLKGAHVGGYNSGNIGVVFNGTTGDTPTYAQARSYRWLLDNAHTLKMPKAHRTDRKLFNAHRYGHREWAGHTSNACPGTHYRLIKTRHR